MRPTEQHYRGLRRSVVDAYHADEPDAASVQRAYLRFSWARRRSTPKANGYRWLALSVGLGLGVASAATTVGVPFRGAIVGEFSTAVPSVTSNDMRPHRDARTRFSPSPQIIPSPVDATDLPEDSIAASAPATSAPATSAPGTSAPGTSAPGTSAPPSSEPDTVEPGWRCNVDALPATQAVRTGVRAPRPSIQVLPKPYAQQTTGDWQRAAQSLRDGDLAAAEEALMRLERSANAADQEAAQLAHAQLHISRAEQSEAKEILQRLAQQARSELVRSQAANILGRL